MIEYKAVKGDSIIQRTYHRVVHGALLVERKEERERRRDDGGAGAQHELRALHVDGGLDEGDEVVELNLGLLDRRDSLRRDGERAQQQAGTRRYGALRH